VARNESFDRTGDATRVSLCFSAFSRVGRLRSLVFGERDGGGEHEQCNRFSERE
jgi:hypothetical protein